MVRSGRVARRYAVAIGELASKEGLLDEVGAELRLLQELEASSDEFNFVLTSPSLSWRQKTHILEATLKGQVSPPTLALLRLLVKKGRAGYLKGIADSFEAFADQARGVRRANVVSAVPIEDEVKEEISEELSKVTGEKMRLEFEVKPQILGGLIVKMGDTVIDGSVAGRLRRLQGSFQALEVRSQG